VLPGDHRLPISTAVHSIKTPALHSTEQNSVTVDIGGRWTNIKLSSRDPNLTPAHWAQLTLTVQLYVLCKTSNYIMIDIDHSSVDPVLSKTDINHVSVNLSCTQTDINFSSVFRRTKLHCDRYHYDRVNCSFSSSSISSIFNFTHVNHTHFSHPSLLTVTSTSFAVLG